jgi:hypothetical protein
MTAIMRVARGLLRNEATLSTKFSQVQQTRNGSHDLHAHKNKYIEEWLTRREDIDNEFVMDKKTTYAALLFVVGIPTAIYNGLVYAQRSKDEYAGRPQKDFLWNHASRG